MRNDNLRAPFDYPNQRLYCSYCGKECQPLGHLMMTFLMCPDHGEFTIAPTVYVVGPDKWEIHFGDETEKAMWETCSILKPGMKAYTG